MIKLDISNIVFYYALFSVVSILIIWIIYGYRGLKRFSVKDINYIWKCSVCLHTYVASKHEDMSLCPLCGSFNKKGVEQ
jgi:rubredoxin